MAAKDYVSCPSGAATSSLSSDEMRTHGEVLEELSELERQFANVELDQRTRVLASTEA
jgi:hypothetical protein